MEIIVVGVALVILAGYLCGTFRRKYRLNRLRKASHGKPLYAIQDDLSPAEFGYIIDGKIGANEFAAEIIQLSLLGYLELSVDPRGTVKIVVTFRTPDTGDELTDIQSAIIKNISRNINSLHDSNSLQLLELHTRRSLDRKGWVTPHKTPLRYMSIMPPKVVGWLTVMVIGVPIIVGAVCVLIGSEFSTTYMVVMLTLTVEMLSMLITGLIITFRGEMLHATGLLLGATTKFNEKWQDVNGVYDYLQISGMDIFTPDYTSLNFQQLDPLYPYAVAAGLDRRIVKMFP